VNSKSMSNKRREVFMAQTSALGGKIRREKSLLLFFFVFFWRTAAAAMESSPSSLSRRTPCVERPFANFVEWTRMTLRFGMNHDVGFFGDLEEWHEEALRSVASC